MFQPKQFYRELERLLHERENDLSRDWYAWVAREIVSRFADTLGIESWRLYEESEGTFELVEESGSFDEGALGLELPITYTPIRFVLENGTYIFDDTVPGQAPEIEGRLGGLESGAVLLRGTPRRLLAFGLSPGWERDNVDFTLNTLRNAINLRARLTHLKTDIQQAAEIQRSLLPEETPAFRGFGIAARSIPAEIVGGDFYDFLRLDPTMLVFSVGDASGHGLGAALLARDVVTGLRMGTESSLKLTTIVSRLNRVIARARLSSRFVSMFYGELDADGALFYVNAGHPPAWVVGEERVQRLDVGGTILGPLDDATFRRGWAQMGPGESLVVVSDGLLERRNSLGTMFADEGVERVVRENVARPASLILEKMFAAAKDHGEGAPWEDDATGVVIARDRLLPGASTSPVEKRLGARAGFIK